MDDPGWAYRQAELREVGRRRRGYAQDAFLYTFLVVVSVVVALVMWRMDGRSERLFNVVATERACTCR